MEDKKLLNNEELETVTGGTGSEQDIKTAFSDAKSDFLILAKQSGANANFFQSGRDVARFEQMAEVCDFGNMGDMDASLAIAMLQRLCDCLTIYQDKAQERIDMLKNAIGQ